MDKLKKMLGGHKEEASSPAASSTPAASTQSSGSTGDGSNASGVTLRTTVGDITIALYADQTPKVLHPFIRCLPTSS